MAYGFLIFKLFLNLLPVLNNLSPLSCSKWRFAISRMTIYDEERTVALFLADALGDQIIEKGLVGNADEATYLSRFFWAMANKSADGNLILPCEGGSQYWTENL